MFLCLFPLRLITVECSALVRRLSGNGAEFSIGVVIHFAIINMQSPVCPSRPFTLSFSELFSSFSLSFFLLSPLLPLIGVLVFSFSYFSAIANID